MTVPRVAISIRRATDADWESIWSIFARVVDDGDTYTYPEDIGEADARTAWMQTPPGFTVVAVDGDEIVGTAKVVANHPGRGSHVANASFMVSPVHTGRGVGRALAHHVLDAARDAGFRAMQFNAVVETNTVAVQLWQSLGFEILATIPEAFEHPQQGLVGMHVMYRRL